MAFDERIVKLLIKFRHFLEIAGQNARLVIVESVNVDHGIILIGFDIFPLAGIHTCRALDRLAQAVTAVLIIADHAPRHTKLLRTHNPVVLCDNARARCHINTDRLTAECIENQRVEHMNTLSNDDGILVALHRLIAARGAGLKIVDRHIDRLSDHQPVDRLDQKSAVDAVR